MRPLPFPHVVVGDRLKINPGRGHGGDVGDIIEIHSDPARIHRFRIVQLFDDGCVLCAFAQAERRTAPALADRTSRRTEAHGRRAKAH